MKKPQTISELIADATLEDMFKLARVTESSERYEDMCIVMGKIVVQKKELTVEERNMLSVAYKNVVGQRRAAWRAIKEEAEKDAEDKAATSKEAKKHYRKVVEAELHAKCSEILDLLSKNLLTLSPDPKNEDYKTLKTEWENIKDDQNPDNKKAKKAVQDKLETQVFYLKMSGDYYRYLAEFVEDDSMSNQAKNHYEKALLLGKSLAPTHPTRLGLALNASVCYWEILKKPEEACKLAKDAFDDAIQKLDSLSDSTYKDSTLIMQLLRDNLTIWTSNEEHNKRDGKVEPEQD